MCCIIVYVQCTLYIEGYHVTRPRPHFTKSFCAVQEKMEEKYFIFSHKNRLFFSFKVFKVKKNPCFSKVSLSFSLLKPCKMSLKFCEFQMNFFLLFCIKTKENVEIMWWPSMEAHTPDFWGNCPGFESV